ncbi:hypothetical protein QE177_02130 [Arsenophonus sp. aPb]|uniref:hypothetical protein n=1 Tax=Arsenophonus sp. aPb TaxID=3041619 RepID=UPI0024697BB9|nr:hypothetical protein [Arsenophonus sp. aPb]WGL98731.1 hypothetical protein QE177_02130 [Arsenophonus sp. aPb]
MPYDNTIDASGAASAYLDLAQSPSKSSATARQFNINQVPLANNVTEWLDLAVKKGEAEASKPLDLTPVIEQQINQSKQYYDEAKQQGVEIAKRSFFKELLNVGIAGVGLGLSIAATLFTAGATMPLLVGSSITFGLAVADAGCAYANWHSEAKGGEGLKLGSDAIANGVYRLLNRAGITNDRAEDWAKYTSAFLRAGLVVGTLYSGGAVTTATLGALSSTFSATKLVSNSVDAFTSRTASVALGNAVEKKNLLQEQYAHQQQKISKLKGMHDGLELQYRERIEQQTQSLLAQEKQKTRQLECEVEWLRTKFFLQKKADKC